MTPPELQEDEEFEELDLFVPADSTHLDSQQLQRHNSLLENSEGSKQLHDVLEEQSQPSEGSSKSHQLSPTFRNRFPTSSVDTPKFGRINGNTPCSAATSCSLFFDQIL